MPPLTFRSGYSGSVDGAGSIASAFVQDIQITGEKLVPERDGWAVGPGKSPRAVAPLPRPVSTVLVTPLSLHRSCNHPHTLEPAEHQLVYSWPPCLAAGSGYVPAPQRIPAIASEHPGLRRRLGLPCGSHTAKALRAFCWSISLNTSGDLSQPIKLLVCESTDVCNMLVLCLYGTTARARQHAALHEHAQMPRQSLLGHVGVS